VRPVLVEKQDGFAGRVDTGFRARGLDFHERDQAVDLGFLRGQFGDDPSQAQCVFAECRAHPVAAGGCGITFVKDEIDDFEDGAETCG